MYEMPSGQVYILTTPKAAEAPAAWPIDLTHLRRYTLGDRQLEVEVLGLFAGELPNTLARLKAAETEHEWRIAAHTLKGSARAVGAWEVAGAAQEAERFSFSLTERDARQAALMPIERAVSDVLSHIRRLATAG